MPDTIPVYVLDSYALFAYFQAESAGPTVRKLLESAKDKRVTLAISLINVGELYYITFREQGAKRADEMLKDLRELPIALYAASEERILVAAKIKAKYSISYADAFAVGLAQELDSTLVTADPEFRSLHDLIKIMWLETKKSKE